MSQMWWIFFPNPQILTHSVPQALTSQESFNLLISTNFSGSRSKYRITEENKTFIFNMCETAYIITERAPKITEFPLLFLGENTFISSQRSRNNWTIG